MPVLSQAVSAVSSVASSILPKIAPILSVIAPIPIPGISPIYRILIDLALKAAINLAKPVRNKIETAANKVLNKVGLTVKDIVSAVNKAAGKKILGSAEALAAVNSQLGFNIQGAVEDGEETSGSISDRIVTFVTTALEPIFDGVEALLNKMEEAIGDVLLSISKIFADIKTAIVDPIVKAVLAGIKTINALFVKFQDTISQTIDAFLERISSAWEKVQTSISEFIDSAKDLASAVIDKISETVIGFVDTLNEFLQTLIQKFLDLIDPALLRAGEIRDALVQRVADIPEELRELRDSLFLALEENVNKPISEMSEALWNQAVKQWTDFVINSDAEQELAANIVHSFSDVIDFGRKDLDKWYEQTLPTNPGIRLLFNIFIYIFMTAQVMGGIAQANAAIILQDHAREFPYLLINEGDTATAWHRGIVTTGEAIFVLRGLGYSETDAGNLLTISRPLPDEQLLLTIWLRDFITEEHLDEVLAQRGWDVEWIAQYKKAAFFIPPVQDLITMAVREVFSPEIAERFGQFQDFPPDFVIWAKRQGVSEEWARNYWAAHWALPSIQMGYEMLHRKVITDTDLDLLMRAQDIMPFWRDKLKQISFHPFTRVDTRRMHKLGILSREQVKLAYQDLGFDDVKSEAMTAFTEEFNRDDDELDEPHVRELSRSSVLNFYADGLLDRDEARDLLIDLGFETDTTELFLKSVDFDEIRHERSESIKLILDKAAAGTLNFNEAQTALDALQLETREKQKALIRLIRMQDRQDRLPSRADMDKFIASNLVSDAEYIDVLERLGYSPKWSNNYLQIIKGKINASS